MQPMIFGARRGALRLDWKLMTLLPLIFAIAAIAAPEAVKATPSTDEAQVTDAMVTMYVAATNDDLSKFRSVAAPDFYSFDGGKRFTGDELMSLIRRVHAEGKVFVWRVTEPEVHVDGKTAWITYVNRGSVQDSSGTKDVTWLESAVLRKQGGRWRIHFFHSTRVP